MPLPFFIRSIRPRLGIRRFHLLLLLVIGIQAILLLLLSANKHVGDRNLVEEGNEGGARRVLGMEDPSASSSKFETQSKNVALRCPEEKLMCQDLSRNEGMSLRSTSSIFCQQPDCHTPFCVGRNVRAAFLLPAHGSLTTTSHEMVIALRRAGRGEPTVVAAPGPKRKSDLPMQHQLPQLFATCSPLDFHASAVLANISSLKVSLSNGRMEAKCSHLILRPSLAVSLQWLPAISGALVALLSQHFHIFTTLRRMEWLSPGPDGSSHLKDRVYMFYTSEDHFVSSQNPFINILLIKDHFDVKQCLPPSSYSLVRKQHDKCSRYTYNPYFKKEPCQFSMLVCRWPRYYSLLHEKRESRNRSKIIILYIPTDCYCVAHIIFSALPFSTRFSYTFKTTLGKKTICFMHWNLLLRLLLASPIWP